MPNSARVPVQIWVKHYESFKPLAGAKITDIVTGEVTHTNHDTSTSHDGGLMFLNVSAGKYVIHAEKKDLNENAIPFSKAAFEIFPSSPLVINLSPPNGPKKLVP